MIKLKKILLESNTDDDMDWELYESLDSMRESVLAEFASGKYKKQPWILVSYARVKKVWDNFVKYRDVNRMELNKIIEILQTNILMLYVNTELAGHTSESSDEYFENYGLKIGEHGDVYNKRGIEFGDYILDKTGSWRISDYAMKPLVNTLIDIRKTDDYAKKLLLADRILNIVHQRSDLSSWFIEGGRTSLNKLSGIEKSDKT